MDNIQELDASFLDDTTLLGEPVNNSSGDEEFEDGLAGITENPVDSEEEEEELDNFQGPETWEEVDPLELEPVMLRVVKAAVPKTRNKEVAERLEALAASAAEHENMDPLGLGRIDATNVILVKNEDIAKGLPKTRQEYRRRGRKINEPIQSGASRRMSHDVDISQLRAKALPDSDAFDADTFLGTLHAGSSLPNLLKGRQNLKLEVSERTGQLIALVKDNFDRFISCKSTIDDIHKRLKISESHGSGSGTSTSDMVVVISEVQEEADLTFAPLLERATHGDQIKNALAFLKRSEHIFKIPEAIKQGVMTNNFDQVISEFRKARALMGKVGKPKPQSLWHNFFSEVEKGAGKAVERLEDILRDVTTPQATAVAAMEYIYQLQAEGLAAALKSSPVVLHTQVHVSALMANLQEQENLHYARLDSAKTHDQVWELRDSFEVKFGKEGSISDSFEPAHAPLRRSGLVWAEFAGEVIQLATRLSAISLTPQARGMQGLVPDIQIKIEKANEQILPMLQEAGSRVHQHIDDALAALSRNHADRVYFMKVIKLLVDTLASFRTNSVQSAFVEDFERHMGVACSLIIEEMGLKVQRITEKMLSLEDFEIVPWSHKAGYPASKVPNMLEWVLSRSLSHIAELQTVFAQGDTEIWSLDALQPHCSALRRTFCESFSSFALAIDRVWGSLVSNETMAEVDVGKLLNTKLLVLYSNTVHLRTHILKDLATRFQSMLTSDGGYAEHRRLMGECVEDMRTLEGRLASLYIKSRAELLNATLNDYFEDDGTNWESAPIPVGVRACTYEIINSLVAVQAELYGNALSLQKRAMDEVTLHLLSAYSQCIEDYSEAINMGGALQLLLELQYISEALQLQRTSRDHLLDTAKASLLKKITDLAADPSSTSFADLNRWCQAGAMPTAGGKNVSYKADVVSRLQSVSIAESSRFNIASFKA